MKIQGRVALCVFRGIPRGARVKPPGFDAAKFDYAGGLSRFES